MRSLRCRLRGFASMRALSTRNDDPQQASRPFDLERDGFVIGEGAGILILEELEFAQSTRCKYSRRDRRLRNERRCISRDDAGRNRLGRDSRNATGDQGCRDSPDEIGYINAHGTSTPYNDKFETLAIKKVFGEHATRSRGQLDEIDDRSRTRVRPAVSKPCFRFWSLTENKLPPTINYEISLILTAISTTFRTQARDAEVEYVLSNSFGFGGTNACLVFKRYTE